MKMSQHIVVSVAVSGVLWLVTRSWVGAATCFLAGVFIDLDHLIDYWINCGPRRPLRQLFTAFRYEFFENIIVFLHAWEWMALVLVVTWWLDWRPAMLGLLVGAASHLAIDHWYNAHSPWAYFLAYRLRHRFSSKHYYGAREYRKRLKWIKRQGHAPPPPDGSK